jgi:hypothetical protein
MEKLLDMGMQLLLTWGYIDMMTGAGSVMTPA